MENKNMGKPMYGIIRTGMSEVKVVSGIVTGVKYTEDKPVYELSFGKNSWSTTEITDNTDDILKALSLTPLDRIKETHGLKIKYNQ